MLLESNVEIISSFPVRTKEIALEGGLLDSLIKTFSKTWVYFRDVLEKILAFRIEILVSSRSFYEIRCKKFLLLLELVCIEVLNPSMFRIFSIVYFRAELT